MYGKALPILSVVLVFALVFSAIAVQPTLASPQEKRVSQLPLLKSADAYGDRGIRVGSVMLYNAGNGLNARAIGSLDDLWLTFSAKTMQKVATKSGGNWVYHVKYFDSAVVVRFYVPTSLYGDESLPLNIKVSYAPVKVVKEGQKYGASVDEEIESFGVIANRVGVEYIKFKGGKGWNNADPVEFGVYEFTLQVDGAGYAKQCVYGLVTVDLGL